MLHRIALLLLILCVSTAAYARSGGSMGGGGFRSHSSGSSFGGSRSSSTPSFGGGSGFGGGSSYGSRTYFVPVPIGGSRYASSGSGDGLMLGFFLLLILVVAVLFAYAYMKTRVRTGGSSGAAASDLIRTARLQFGIQMQAWALVDRLDTIARKAHTTDSQGLHDMLIKSVGAIRPFVDNVEYTAMETKETKDPIEAERQFGRWTGAARSSYNREVVRADRFGVQEEQREMATDGIHDEDGQFAVAEFFVLTIVIGMQARRGANPFAAGSKAKILDSLTQLTTAELLALEIIWTPASKSDAMSREDLETTFPDLVAL